MCYRPYRRKSASIELLYFFIYVFCVIDAIICWRLQYTVLTFHADCLYWITFMKFLTNACSWWPPWDCICTTLFRNLYSADYKRLRMWKIAAFVYGEGKAPKAYSNGGHHRRPILFSRGERQILRSAVNRSKFVVFNLFTSTPPGDVLYSEQMTTKVVWNRSKASSLWFKWMPDWNPPTETSRDEQKPAQDISGNILAEQP